MIEEAPPQSSDESRQSRDRSYSHRSRSPPSESFSAYSRLDKLERNKSKRGEGSFHPSMGNDVMSRALRQISKSPFVRRIIKAKLPHRFTRSTFTIYNGKNDQWSM